jgi:hypothetical protein
MKTLKTLLFYLFVHSLFLNPLTAQLKETKELEQAINTLAALRYHLEDTDPEEQTISLEADIAFLWNKLLDFSAAPEVNAKIQSAYEHYYRCLEQDQGFEEFVFLPLKHAWEELIEEEARLESSSDPLLFYAKSSDLLDHNEAIPSKARKAMRPYVISSKHPARPILDFIFNSSRATLDEHAFQLAGFQTLCSQPRTYIRVASHPLLQGYLVKAYLDNDLRKKRNKDSWEWLVCRCEGTEKITDVIKRKHIRHFVVPKKNIYPLPAHPSPPVDANHTRHLAILLVTNMNITSLEDSIHAWYHYITKEHLDELYMIISRAKGSSYRPDNIPYSYSGKFAFIDTEYPDKGPDYKSIKRYLRLDMLKYWEKLIKNGGPN